jgi:imidazoleglycerol phosphate synthase glutamine amidotransferase subunit HisH
VIALLDYGSGNLRSVHKSLLKVGVRRCRAIVIKLGAA